MIQEQARTEKLLHPCDDLDGKVGVPVVLLVNGLDNLQCVSDVVLPVVGERCLRTRRVSSRV
jgi:hypothetical protein